MSILTSFIIFPLLSSTRYSSIAIKIMAQLNNANTSSAVWYETGGIPLLDSWKTTMLVRKSVTITVTRAGTADGGIQKVLHERTTIRMLGMYTRYR